MTWTFLPLGARRLVFCAVAAGLAFSARR